MNNAGIRLAVTGDAPLIIDLHQRAIRALCRDDYSQQQLDAWIGRRSPQYIASMMLTRPFFVADMHGQVVGYVIYLPRTGEVGSLYVDPDYARQGIASQLMEAVLASARRLGLASLWLDASLTAVPFYESVGFKGVAQTTHSFQGIPLECLRMEIVLTD